MAGSSSISRTSARLRTTCRWTWLSAGTSMTTSPSINAWQDRRRLSFIPFFDLKRASTSLKPVRCSSRLSIPCLEKDPTDWTTWQRPQMPRPPQTESTSTPRARAAFRTGVPTGNRPRRPEGVKTTKASSGMAAPSSFSLNAPRHASARKLRRGGGGARGAARRRNLEQDRPPARGICESSSRSWDPLRAGHPMP